MDLRKVREALNARYPVFVATNSDSAIAASRTLPTGRDQIRFNLHGRFAADCGHALRGPTLPVAGLVRVRVATLLRKSIASFIRMCT